MSENQTVWTHATATFVTDPRHAVHRVTITIIHFQV